MPKQSLFRYIDSASLHVSKPTHWLTSRFHFSFADYYNPKNLNFGVLRVMNDDLVTPKNGFGSHPHQDQEIVSFIVRGELTHQDSQGNKESLGRGSVQYMSAGRGVWHSEFNASPTETCRFIQIWISPSARGLPTQYGSRTYDPSQRLNAIQHVVAPDNDPKLRDNSALIGIHQDANIYVSEVIPGNSVDFKLEKRRQAYLLCIEGSLEVTAESEKLQQSMRARDALEILGPIRDLKLRSTSKENENALWLMVEMKQEKVEFE